VPGGSTRKRIDTNAVVAKSSIPSLKELTGHTEVVAEFKEDCTADNAIGIEVESRIARIEAIDEGDKVTAGHSRIGNAVPAC
jgi:hydrogenase maturation factor